MELSWIIISILFITLILFLVIENKPSNVSKHHFKINNELSFNTSEERIITIRLYLEKATNLDHLINEFKKNNINLNKKGVFEYIENKKTVFTIANLYEPGYFKDALNIRGLTFFFITSNPIEDKKALNKMYSHAYEVNSNIEGKIYDDQGKIINDQNYIDILNERT